MSHNCYSFTLSYIFCYFFTFLCKNIYESIKFIQLLYYVLSRNNFQLLYADFPLKCFVCGPFSTWFYFSSRNREASYNKHTTSVPVQFLLWEKPNSLLISQLICIVMTRKMVTITLFHVILLLFYFYFFFRIYFTRRLFFYFNILPKYKLTQT